MFGLGLSEILLIFLIMVLIFGVGKLPQIGEGLGKGLKNFKKSLQEGKEGPSKQEDHKEE